jgi:hypothetical protein
MRQLPYGISPKFREWLMTAATRFPHDPGMREAAVALLARPQGDPIEVEYNRVGDLLHSYQLDRSYIAAHEPVTVRGARALSPGFMKALQAEVAGHESAVERRRAASQRRNALSREAGWHVQSGDKIIALLRDGRYPSKPEERGRVERLAALLGYPGDPFRSPSDEDTDDDTYGC